MIADKSITAEEGSELLNALAATRRIPQKQRITLARGQKLMLAGAVLIAVGFFLPWFAYNPGREVNRLAQQMGTEMNTQITSMPANPSGSVSSMQMPSINLKTQDVQIYPSQLSSGLGWIILLLTAGAAGLQFLSDVFTRRTRRLVETLCLVASGFLLLYLGGNSLRFVAIGFMVVLIGYVCELLGFLQTTRTPTALLRTAPEHTTSTYQTSPTI